MTLVTPKAPATPLFHGKWKTTLKTKSAGIEPTLNNYLSTANNTAEPPDSYSRKIQPIVIEIYSCGKY